MAYNNNFYFSSIMVPPADRRIAGPTFLPASNIPQNLPILSPGFPILPHVLQTSDSSTGVSMRNH